MVALAALAASNAVSPMDPAPTMRTVSPRLRPTLSKPCTEQASGSASAVSSTSIPAGALKTVNAGVRGELGHATVHIFANESPLLAHVVVAAVAKRAGATAQHRLYADQVPLTHMADTAADRCHRAAPLVARHHARPSR